MESALMEALKRETEARNRQTRTIRTFLGAVCGLALVGSIWLYFRRGEFETGWLPAAIILLTGGIAAGASPSLKKLVTESEVLRDPRSIGPLLELHDSGDQQILATVRAALANHANGLDTEDRVELTAKQRRDLDVWFKETSPELKLALLKIARLGGDADNLKSIDAESKRKDPKTESVALMAAGDLRLYLAKATITVSMGQTSETVSQ